MARQSSTLIVNLVIGLHLRMAIQSRSDNEFSGLITLPYRYTRLQKNIFNTLNGSFPIIPWFFCDIKIPMNVNTFSRHAMRIMIKFSLPPNGFTIKERFIKNTMFLSFLNSASVTSYKVSTTISINTATIQFSTASKAPKTLYK